MPALSSHSNVENTAAVLLERKGYQLWRDDESQTVMAEKDGWDFAASGLIELLGIIAIFESLSPEAYREYWWRIREPWLLNSLARQPKPYNSVLKRTLNNP